MAFEIDRENLLILYIISSILFIKNQYMECLRILNVLEQNVLKANETGFDLHQIYIDKGNCNYLLRRYNAAKNEYEKALKINERSRVAGYNLANTCYLTAENNRAIEVLEHTLKYNPDFQEAQNKLKDFQERLVIIQNSNLKD
jgi:tetratricopeptide (TPR) repeat protein